MEDNSLYTVVLLCFCNSSQDIITIEVYGMDAVSAAKVAQGNIRTPTKVVATIAGSHSNLYFDGIVI